MDNLTHVVNEGEINCARCDRKKNDVNFHFDAPNANVSAGLHWYESKPTDIPTLQKCELCGEPMPKGEEMFKYHGYSGPCPKPLPESQGSSEERAFRKAMSRPAEVWYPCGCKASSGAPRWCPEHDKRIAVEPADTTNKNLGEEIERLRTQLAGCSMAALGTGTHAQAKQGDYGWSVAYQDVLDLRAKYDAAEKLAEEWEAEAARRGMVITRLQNGAVENKK